MGMTRAVPRSPLRPSLAPAAFPLLLLSELARVRGEFSQTPLRASASGTTVRPYDVLPCAHTPLSLSTFVSFPAPSSRVASVFASGRRRCFFLQVASLQRLLAPVDVVALVLLHLFDARELGTRPHRAGGCVQRCRCRSRGNQIKRS